MNYNKRGEIAILLTLGLVIVGTIITLATSLFVNNQKTNLALNSRAETQCAWGDWDCAASGANNEAGRICANMGKSFCAPGDKRPEPGNPNNVCVPNRWDTTWGCWGSLSSANVPGTPDSPPVPGDSCGLIQSQYGACPDSATENSCYQRLDPKGDPDYGKWFKCVNRWWNGPCASKEACEGGVAKPPADTSKVVRLLTPAATATPTPTTIANKCERSLNSKECSFDHSGWIFNSNTGMCCPRAPTSPPAATRTPTPTPLTTGKLCSFRNPCLKQQNCSVGTCVGRYYCCLAGQVTPTPPAATKTPPAGGGTPIPILTNTPIPIPGVCTLGNCPSPDQLAPYYYKLTGLQRNYYKIIRDCNSNINSFSNYDKMIIDYCPNYKRVLTANVTLNLTNNLTDARPDSPYNIEIITTDLNSTILLAEQSIDKNNILSSYSLSFTEKRYRNYQAQFCYETSKRSCVRSGCTPYEQKCPQSAELSYPEDGVLNITIAN